MDLQVRVGVSWAIRDPEMAVGFSLILYPTASSTSPRQQECPQTMAKAF